jgi:hypothetical protein
VAIIDGDRILIESKDKAVKFYEYRLWTDPKTRELKNDAAADALRRKLDAYLQTATQSLLDNTTGLVPKTRKGANRNKP